MARRYTLTSRDVEAINNTAARLGIRPQDLTAVIMYETVGTMNPDIVGGKGNNYQGLIQFGENERRDYGYRKGMGFAEQVEGPVYRYLKDRGLKPGMDIGRLYRTINGGNPNAKLTKNDGNGTIAQHIERIKARFLPRATAVLQATPAGPNIASILDVAALNDAPAPPDQMTAAQGYAPAIASSPAQSAIADLLSEDDIDRLTMVDENGNYLTPPVPMPPAAPPQWKQVAGFPIDEALTGMSPEQVLAGGPRMDPRRVPIDPSLTGRSPADVLGAGPNLSPRALAQIDRLNTAMVPRPRPEGRWLEGAGGAPDADAVPNPPMRPEPFPSLFPPRPEGPAGGMPRAPWEPTIAGRPEGPAPSGMPPAPPTPRLMTDGGQELYGPGNAAGRSRYNTYQYMQDFDRRMAEDLAASESRDLAFDEGRRRAEMEALQPPYRAPPPPTMGERFDSVAGDRSNAGQIFGLPDLNGASFPAPDPVIGTAEAGSTTGEFFTPAPPMPPQPPDTLAGRFDDAFAPAPPTAMDGINSVFGAPPASAGVPNLAIPFAEVPGFDMGRFADAPPVPSPGDLFGSAPAEAATIASPLPKPAGPPSISMADFDSRFGGGTVVTPPVPRPGQPGVSLGTMPTPADAMDIRPPDMGGPAFTPRPSLPAPPTPAPRQRNPGAERNGPKLGGIAGRVLGGLLGGPLGAIGGGFLGRGLLNGGGGGFGFGQPATYNWTTGGTAPYGSGTTTWQGGTSNALGGSNALSWQGSGGQTVTVVQDPWSGGYYGPTVSGGGLY